MSDQIATATKRVMSAIVRGAPDAPDFPDGAGRSGRPLGLVYTAAAIVVVVAVALALVVTKLPTRDAAAPDSAIEPVPSQFVQDMVASALVNASPFQAEILIDGRVDFAEYQRAVEATLACARQAGLETVGPTLDPDGITFSYSYRGLDADGTVLPDSIVASRFGPCYSEFSERVESVWFAQHATFDAPQDLKTAYAQCFASYGFEISPKVHFVEFARLIQENPVLKECADELGSSATP